VKRKQALNCWRGDVLRLVFDTAALLQIKTLPPFGVEVGGAMWAMGAQFRPLYGRRRRSTASLPMKKAGPDESGPALKF
jgi:hypothetical protein